MVGGRGTLDLADALVDGRGVARELLVQRDLAGIDLVLGLLLDPGDLGARPFLDPGDVLVAAAAERALALLGAGADLRDHGRDVGVDLGQRLLTRRLRRGADRRGQVGHQLRRLLGRRRSRRRDGRGLDHLGLLGVDGGDRVGRGRGVAGVGRTRLRGEPEAFVDVGRRPRDGIVPGCLGGGLGRLVGGLGGRRGLVGSIGAPGEPEAGAGIRGGHGAGTLPRGRRQAGACTHHRRQGGLWCSRRRYQRSGPVVPGIAWGASAGRVRRPGYHALVEPLLDPVPPVPSSAFDGRPGMPDRFGRALRDLRISVTDRCNFRCPYCMPAEIFGRDFAFLPHDQVLSFEEITRLAGIFVGLGVTKLRITGGEPLVRRDLPVLIGELATLRTPEGDAVDLTLTTNGSALEKLARPLREAGLQRITVSLDSLDDEVFGRMNGVDFPVSRVLDGIVAARDAGLAPIKVNTVVRRGLNEDSILPLARWARDEGLILRFIEYMDVGTTNGWRLDDVVSGRGDPGGDRRRPAAGAGRGELPGRGRRPVPLPRRHRRGGRDRERHAPVLRRLHARAPVRGGLAVHVPVRVDAARTSRGRSGTGRPTRSSPTGSAACGRSAPTATPSSGARRRSACPRWRCSPSGVDARGAARSPAAARPARRGARSGPAVAPGRHARDARWHARPHDSVHAQHEIATSRPRDTASCVDTACKRFAHRLM